MRAEIELVHDGGRSLRETLSGRWRELCAIYLPVAPGDSMWRFSRAAVPSDPEQGWKLHVSATILTANVVFERVAPFLSGRKVLFKAPVSLEELEKINSGLFYGYSQVGKFITVYPQTGDEARSLARRLHVLTRGMAAPAVPFEPKCRPGSNVSYRYGAFSPLAITHPDGTSTPALRDPEGRLVPDLRETAAARPEWVREPLFGARVGAPASATPLETTFRVFRALTQRGKGGVYQAVDLSARPPRLCLLKEGRRNGEPGWDGRDGRQGVRQEEYVLPLLRARGLDVPRVRTSFEAGGNYYLVTEFVEGENLHTVLSRMKRRMSVRRTLLYSLQLADFIAQMHSAGWLWLDCKPANIMVTKKGRLRPLDFEGACPVERPDAASLGTAEFNAPERSSRGWRPGVGDDLYSLGAVIYLLLTGREPAAGAPAVGKLRRNVPAEVCELVGRLLSTDPRRRPAARTVARRLRALDTLPPTATR